MLIYLAHQARMDNFISPELLERAAVAGADKEGLDRIVTQFRELVCCMTAARAMSLF